MSLLNPKEENNVCLWVVRNVYCKARNGINLIPRKGSRKCTDVARHIVIKHTLTRSPAFVWVCFLCNKIKESLRRWNCVCIEAFGSFSQRRLCCHGDACWIRVLSAFFFFSSPPTTWDHFITWTTYKNFHVQRVFQLAVNRFTVQECTRGLSLQRYTGVRWKTKAHAHAWMQKGQTNIMNAEMMLVHSWRVEHSNSRVSWVAGW